MIGIPSFIITGRMDTLPVLNGLLYPAPTPPTYTIDSIKRATTFSLLLPEHDPIFIIGCTPRALHGLDHVILYCHGNAMDLGMAVSMMTKLADYVGLPVYAFEYPGYGPTQGRLHPSAALIKRWAEIACDTIRGLTGKEVIIYGHSIGTGPACHLARVRPCVALILQSPFTSVTELAAELVARWLWYVTPRLFDNVAAIKSCTAPILFLHGGRDTLIAPHHSEKLQLAASRASSTKRIVAPNVDHNSWDWQNDVFKPIYAFLWPKED